jgi:hypothetical protein
MDAPGSDEQYAASVPAFSPIFSLAVLFVFLQVMRALFTSLDQSPLLAITIYAMFGAIAHVEVASVFLRSDPRIWRKNTAWYRTNISALEPTSQMTAQAAAWGTVAPRLTLDNFYRDCSRYSWRGLLAWRGAWGSDRYRNLCYRWCDFEAILAGQGAPGFQRYFDRGPTVKVNTRSTCLGTRCRILL